MSKLNCRVTGRRVLCRYVVPEDTLQGGHILLLDDSKKAITAQQGVVERVGSGDYDEEGDFVPTSEALKPGAWILHAPWKRTPTWDDNLFILNEDDVIAVFEVI